MKKIIILSLFALIAITSTAQKISGGVVFSPLVSWMKPDTKNIEREKSMFGFNYGLVGDYNLSDRFALSTGILMNHFGGGIKYLDSIPKFKGDTIYSLPKNTIIDYKLKYIEIPISIKFKTEEIGYITYFLQSGINPYFRLDAKGDANNEGITDDDVTEEVSFINMGYNFGAGMEYSLGGNTSFLAEIIFVNGLTDITKDDEKVILNNIALRIGFVF